MKYGTWTTIDCPTQALESAKRFLEKQFEKIDGKVRLLMNDHDFGSYPSFEIDFPEHLEDVDEDEDSELAKEKNLWIDKANRIEKIYYKKFKNYL